MLPIGELFMINQYSHFEKYIWKISYDVGWLGYYAYNIIQEKEDYIRPVKKNDFALEAYL